jgi:predicted PurR-regulated permease PerM
VIGVAMIAGISETGRQCPARAMRESGRKSRVRELEDKTFLLLVAAVSLVFGWILWSFYGAILWATVLAILFAPLYRRVLGSMPQWRNLAALATLLVIVVMVILPLALITDLLVREAATVYKSIQSGELSFSLNLRQVRDALPGWAINLLDRFELPDLDAVRERLSTSIMESGRFLAGQAINIGQTTVDFVVSLFIMLYLLFFLLRDGRELSRQIGNAIPLYAEQKRVFLGKFTGAIRATVKGSIVVALVQGALGGLIFWFLGIRAPLLWAALMAVLSLLPVVGTGLVWGPVAIYLLATGAIWQGIVLIAYGVLIIGLVDNILRPILIGQNTKIPDYVVLISTLGGIATFGANGFVIGPVIAAMFLAAWDSFSVVRYGTKNDRIER